MKAQARAGIEFVGRSMRYSEIEHLTRRRRLLRLGNCDFEFDAARELFGVEESGYLDTIADAIGDVFAGSAASRFTIALHSPTSRTFMASVPGGTSEKVRDQRMQLEAALVDSAVVEGFGRVRTGVSNREETTDGSPVVRTEVSVVHQRIERRLRTAVSSVSRGAVDMISSLTGVARTMSAVRDKGRGTLLAIGLYRDHVEYSVFARGSWRYSTCRSGLDDGDTAYFALAALNAAGCVEGEAVSVRTYGDPEMDPVRSRLDSLFNEQVLPLNPIEAVDLDPASIDDSFRFDAYVPCIGAAL